MLLQLVLIGEHDRQNGLAVVAGAAESLELDRDGVGIAGHQKEDREENGVGVAGLDDRKPEDE